MEKMVEETDLADEPKVNFFLSLGKHYEQMVTDHESQTRRLLEYCGLPWEDQCLRFYETK